MLRGRALALEASLLPFVRWDDSDQLDRHVYRVLAARGIKD